MKTDKFNWILVQGHVATEEDVANSKKKNLQVGDFVEDNKTYHMTVQRLLERVLEHCMARRIKKGELKTIATYVDEMKNLQADFLEKTKHLKIYISDLEVTEDEEE
jgi:hypothetical protein